jgi:hypothetical protein
LNPARSNASYGTSQNIILRCCLIRLDRLRKQVGIHPPCEPNRPFTSARRNFVLSVDWREGCEAFTAVTQLSLKSDLSDEHDAVRHFLLPEREKTSWRCPRTNACRASVLALPDTCGPQDYLTGALYKAALVFTHGLYVKCVYTRKAI